MDSGSAVPLRVNSALFVAVNGALRIGGGGAIKSLLPESLSVLNFSENTANFDNNGTPKNPNRTKIPIVLKMKRKAVRLLRFCSREYNLLRYILIELYHKAPLA